MNATAAHRSQIVPFSGVYAPYVANTDPKALFSENRKHISTEKNPVIQNQKEMEKMKKENREYYDKMALAKMNGP